MQIQGKSLSLLLLKITLKLCLKKERYLIDVFYYYSL